MKIYDKWKEMKASTKFGLACTVVYAATLAAPIVAIAEPEIYKEKIELNHSLNLETITTSEQAENLYKEKLKEYSSDNLFQVEEVENLYKIKKREGFLLKEEGENFQYTYNVNTDTSKIDSEIRKSENKLKEETKVSVFDPIRKKVEDKIITYYPGINSKDSKWNVTYTAESNLHPGLSSVFKDLVIEADALMKKYNGGSKLGLLLNKESYQLQDILAFYTIIEKQDYFDKGEKDSLRAKLIKLREAKMELLESRENRDLFHKIEEVSFALETNSDELENFGKYFRYGNLISRFEKEVGNFNNDWMHSFIKSDQIEDFGLEPSANDRFNALELKEEEFDEIQEEAVSELQQYLNSIIFDNQLAFNLPAVEDIGNPAAKKFPWWLGSWVIGCGAPILRNLLIKGYTRGSNINDEIEYVGSAMAGFGNGIVGLFFIDGLAPWVFPARMLSPLILQPAFKLMKWDPARDFSKGW